MAEVELLSSSPVADPSGSLWFQGSSQQTTELKPTSCCSSPDPEPGRETYTNTMFLILPVHPAESSIAGRRPDLQQHQTGGSCPCLSTKCRVTLQWIPCHCGVGGNEEADWLSKMGNKLEQSAHPMSSIEVKSILRNNFRTEWRQRLDIGTEEDSIHQLDTAAQVTIFRLRSGHCQLIFHLHRLKISHSDECPCGTGPQTLNHTLQSCPTFDTLKRQI